MRWRRGLPRTRREAGGGQGGDAHVPRLTRGTKRHQEARGEQRLGTDLHHLRRRVYSSGRDNPIFSRALIPRRTSFPGRRRAAGSRCIVIGWAALPSTDTRGRAAADPRHSIASRSFLPTSLRRACAVARSEALLSEASVAASRALRAWSSMPASKKPSVQGRGESQFHRRLSLSSGGLWR